MAATIPQPVLRSGRYISDRWYLRALLGGALLSLLLAVVITWVDYAGSPTDQRVALTFLINLIAVIGLQVFMGNSGVPSFGHVGFVSIGAYASAIVMTPTERKAADTLIPDAPSLVLNTEVGFYVALAISVVVVALVAAPAGAAIVRLRGGSAAIATLAFLLIVRTVVGNWEDITRGPKTWSGIPDYTTIWTALGFAIVAILIARLFRESGIGLRLRATRTDELACGAVGVNISRTRFSAWMLSAIIAGAAGVLWATYFLSLAPQDFFFDLTFLYIVMVILGGSSVSGAVVGAAAVTLITEFVRRQETNGLHFGPVDLDQLFGLTPLALGLLVLLTVILRPEGILGRWELDEWLMRWGSRLRRVRRGGARTSTAASDVSSETGSTGVSSAASGSKRSPGAPTGVPENDVTLMRMPEDGGRIQARRPPLSRSMRVPRDQPDQKGRNR
jgi:branched-chain amino acid transport system permease protein